jgi:hypothetical protein
VKWAFKTGRPRIAAVAELSDLLIVFFFMVTLKKSILIRQERGNVAKSVKYATQIFGFFGVRAFRGPLGF